MRVLILLAALLVALPRGVQTASAQNPPKYHFLEDGDEDQFNVDFNLVPSASATGAVTAVFNYKDAKNFYALDFSKSEVSLRSVLDGSEHKLASASLKLVGKTAVTLQRRPWLMRVLIGSQVVLTAYDTTLSQGEIGFETKGGWTVSDSKLQPVEAELFFNDDFTRVPGSDGEWKVQSGTWQLTSTSDRINEGNQDMSANPFSYNVAGSPSRSMVTAGRWFWDNYDVQASVRPAEQGSVGLAFYYQDANNFLALMWSSVESPDARRLVKVENGKATVLARAPGAYLPRQWYRLGVRTSPGYVEGFIDEKPIFRERENAFGQGTIGLLAQGTAANFDDVRVRSFPYFRQDFNGPTGGAWTPIGGFWRAADGTLNSASKPGDGGATRMLLAGGRSWSNYEMSASGRAGDSGSCGVVIGYQDDKNYLVYRWAGPNSTLPFKGRAQLLRYKDGTAKFLSDSPVPSPDADGWLRIRARFVSGAVTIFSNDDIVAQAADVSLQAGQPGLWAQGASVVSFSNAVLFLPPEPDPPRVAPKMEKDALMVGWASPTGEWPPRRNAKNQLEFWNTGEFFGNAQIEYIWRPTLNASGAWEAALRADDSDFESGYVLRVEAKDKTTLKFSLRRKGAVLVSQETSIAPPKYSDSQPPKLRVALEGRAILASIDKTPVLSYLPPSGDATPAGTHIAIRTEGFILQAKDMRAESDNRDDYTFNKAPTDWYSPSGIWSIFSRWPCYSDWSFFGGTGQSPVLWSKREYSGDTVAEIYSHPQMNMPKEIGYAHPGDLNITLAGDGKTVSSGYSFVVAGWYNTRTAILRNNVVVAQNTSSDASFNRAINQNSHFHRKWYYIRAETRHAQKDGKDGALVRLSIDNKVLCEYFDANPLPRFQNGGRVAFWTVDGAMMIARAKVESAAPGARSLPDGLLDADAQSTPPANGVQLRPVPALQNDMPSSIVAAIDGGWKITNPAGGGIFAIDFKRGDGTSNFKATSATLIDMDLNLPSDVRVDLYVTIDGARHLIEVNGGQKNDASAPRLGTASISGTGDSRHLSFELGKALAEKFPASKSWAIEKMEMGALHGDAYRWQGFDGNALGANYVLTNFRVTG